MKKWKKYLISTIIFFSIYVLLGWLFIKQIDWKITITSTVIYAILYPICDMLFSKKID